MEKKQLILRKITPILVYGRPILVFAGMVCAMSVMLTRNSSIYLAGTLLLFTSMVFDLVDGWFSQRFSPNPTLAELADLIMDRVVYSIVFPLVAVGMMWRLLFVSPAHSRLELLHAIFVLIICVTVLVRNNFAHFMRGFALRYGQEPELRELTRLRTIVAAPLGLLMYIHAFYVPASGDGSIIYDAVLKFANLPLRNLFIIEIIFLIINFGSIAGYCRKYGTYCLDEICLDDNLLRRKILSVFPNTLTAMNAIMGLLAVFFAYQGKMTESYLLVIGAAVFDKLDGAMARKLGLTEPLPGVIKGHITFGGLMDDIADGISFCIAPAWIFYIVLAKYPNPDINSLPIGTVAIIYALAGFIRLVYFTLDKNSIPGMFKGLPTPAAALFVISPLVVIAHTAPVNQEWIKLTAFFTFGLFIFTAVLMNFYPIKYLHMGRFMDRNPRFMWSNLTLIIIFVFTPWFGYFVFFLMLLYIFSPIVSCKMDPAEAAREGRKTATKV
ncbi:MAG: CDP-alcohol phosphatidyltransferase family protein [Desulfamplus sp.]|nr:CDP-alcohol phosphatidyltransferase family protein [Desulfamplus sp.]MBF0413386.1 CDP-alcohol phosphatidyltransferase family protein [Desulfamplus sp.]